MSYAKLCDSSKLGNIILVADAMAGDIDEPLASDGTSISCNCACPAARHTDGRDSHRGVVRQAVRVLQAWQHYPDRSCHDLYVWLAAGLLWHINCACHAAHHTDGRATHTSLWLAMANQNIDAVPVLLPTTQTGETRIGVSYAKLCESSKPGNIILIADGVISIEVVRILSDKELLGRVVNSHKLGQRKNCNLPGELPSECWLICLEDEVVRDSGGGCGGDDGS